MAIKEELTPFQLEVTRNARKILEKLSTENAIRIEDALIRLCLTAQGDVVFLGNGYAGDYRLRVGNLRIFFDVRLTDRVIVVTEIEKRGEAYTKKSKKR